MTSESSTVEKRLSAGSPEIKTKQSPPKISSEGSSKEYCMDVTKVGKSRVAEILRETNE